MGLAPRGKGLAGRFGTYCSRRRDRHAILEKIIQDLQRGLRNRVDRRTACGEEARRFRYRTQGKPILLWLVDGVALRHHRAIGLSAAGVRRHSAHPHGVASPLTRSGSHIKLMSRYPRERGSCDHGGSRDGGRSVVQVLWRGAGAATTGSANRLGVMEES